MSQALRVASLVCFIIAAVICKVVDAPDVLVVFTAISVGLGAWVASTLVQS